MPTFQSYQLWKWKELAHRRIFYVVLFQFILTFLWLSLYSVVTQSDYFDPKKENALVPLALIISCFHAAACLFFLFTDKGRTYVRKDEGKYVCTWSVLSLLANELFQILVCHYKVDEDATTQTAVLFAVSSYAGVQMVSQLGASIVFVAGCKIITLIWWIMFLTVLKVKFAAAIALIGCLVAFHTFGVVTESEFWSCFQRLKSASMSTWELVEDTVYAAQMIDEAIAYCRIIMHPQLKSKYLSAQSHRNYDDSGVSQISKSFRELLHLMPIRDQKHAILAESEYLCRALYCALRNDPEVSPRMMVEDKRHPRSPTQFDFQDACCMIISMLEVAVGYGLPFYIDDNAQKVSITGPRATFELLLLLLLYDSAHVSPGVCILSCDGSATEGWKLKVQTTTLHRRGSSAVSRSPHLAEERDGSQVAQRRAPRVISESWLWAKSLLDAQSSEKRSCLQRLADHISRKSLQEPVMEAEPEYREGYKITTRSIALQTDVFSCKIIFGKHNTHAPPSGLGGGQHSSSASAPSAAHTGGHVLSRGANSFSSNDHGISGEESVALMADANDSSARVEASAPSMHTPAATASRSSEECIEIDSWVLLVPRMHDADDLMDIKNKIDILAIPSMGCITVMELSTQNYAYNCAVVSESYLKLLGKQHCGVINGKIKQVVVAHEDVSNEDYFFFEYGVRIACMLPLHGSSLKQVVDCVQLVAKRQGPRHAPGTSPIKPSVSIQSYVTQWVALLGQFRDLGSLTPKGFDIVSNMIYSSQELPSQISLAGVQDAILAKLQPEESESSFARSAKRFLRAVDLFVSKARKAVKERNLQDLERVLNDAMLERQITDILPTHAFIRNIHSVAKLCLGAQHDEASSVQSDVMAFNPRIAGLPAVMDLSEAPLRHILSKMIELILICSWDVVLGKELETCEGQRAN